MSVQSQIDRISANIAETYIAIDEMGGTLPEEQVTENLAEAVRSIPVGGGDVTSPPDPLEVYNATRPADWLPMPEPQDNEMYLLFHIPDGLSSLLAFTVTCTGSYTVATGTVENGAFVQSGAVSVASEQKYEAELFADDYGNLTSTGMKQCMVKVTGTNILTWEPSTHSKKTAPTNFSSWNIVEISCRLPSGEKVTCGNNTQNKALRGMRYFSWYGENNATNMSYMFSYCVALIAILQLDTANVTNMGRIFVNCNSLTAIPQLNTANATSLTYMFSGCYSLTAIPQLNMTNVTDTSRMFGTCYSLTTIPQMDTANVTNMSSMFSGCDSLTAIPQMDTSSVTNMSSMFSGCYSLTAIPQLDTSSVTNMSSMFQNCYSLTAIPQMNMANVTSMGSMFTNCHSLTAIPQMNIAKATDMSDTFNPCYSLTKFTLDPTVANWAGYGFKLTNCSFTHQALVDLFNSLPVITTNKYLYITGNPGVSELTDAEKAIAAGKNWTLSM